MLNGAGSTAGPMGEIQMQRLCDYVGSLHADDQKLLLEYLACLVLESDLGRHAILREDRRAVGFLVPLRQMLQLTETPEQKAQLDQAIARVRDHRKQ